MANEKFLKKVYDQYLNTDYEYGVSNLNPKREISIESIEATKDITEKIEDEIRRQFNELKDKADKLLDFSVPNTQEFSAEDDKQVQSGNFLGAKRPEGNGPQLPKTGGSVLDDTIDDSPLLDEIDDLILKLSVIIDLPPIEIPDRDPSKPKEYASLIKELDIPVGTQFCGPHSFSPGGIAEAKDYEEDFALITKPISSSSGLENQGELDNNTLVVQEGSEGGKKNQSDVDFKESKLPSLRDLKNSWLNLMPVSCILQDLSILRVILVICKILGILKKVILMVLTIGVPLIKIASRCCGCWVNPPSAAEAIQLVMEKVGSIIMGIISELLQFLWNMLGFDCMDDMASSLLDQITEALTAIGGISCIGSKEWNMVTDAYKSAMDEAVEAGNKLKAQLEEWDKGNHDLGEKAKQSFNDVFGKCKNQAKDMFFGQFTGSNTAGSIKNLEKAAETMKENFAKEKENLVKLAQENQEKQRKAAEESNTPTMGSMDGGIQN